MLSDDRPTDPAWLPIFSKEEHFMGNAFGMIGRTAGNYIAGIAFAIPACAGIGFLLIHIFVHLFQKPMDENSLPYSEELWILGWILACACVLWWKMHRDHYRDL